MSGQATIKQGLIKEESNKHNSKNTWYKILDYYLSKLENEDTLISFTIGYEQIPFDLIKYREEINRCFYITEYVYYDRPTNNKSMFRTLLQQYCHKHCYSIKSYNEHIFDYSKCTMSFVMMATVIIERKK